MRAIESRTYTFVEKRRDEFKISWLKSQDLWWYAPHVADFNTAVICVSGNDDRLIQQIHITNRFFQRKQLPQYRSLFTTRTTQGSLQRYPANIFESRKTVKSILLGIFNNHFSSLEELIKNNEEYEVDYVHYNH